MNAIIFNCDDHIKYAGMCFLNKLSAFCSAVVVATKLVPTIHTSHLLVVQCIYLNYDALWTGEWPYLVAFFVQFQPHQGGSLRTWPSHAVFRSFHAMHCRNLQSFLDWTVMESPLKRLLLNILSIYVRCIVIFMQRQVHKMTLAGMHYDHHERHGSKYFY